MTKAGKQADVEVFLSKVAGRFTDTIKESGFTFDLIDRKEWIDVFRGSAVNHLESGWGTRWPWYGGLGDSIARLAMALSLPGPEITRPALFLAAILVSYSCPGKGKPCSNVTVDNFANRTDAAEIRKLYRKTFKHSGLLEKKISGAKKKTRSKANARKKTS